MPRLSIVIPCLGGAAEFDGTLVSVLQNRPADCEVLVLHAEPYDDPYGLGDEVRFVETKSQSLVELLNIGVQESSGEVLHIVGCGLEVSEGWTGPAMAHFDDPDVAAVSPIVFSPNRESIVAAGVRWSHGGARHIVRDSRVTLPGSGRLRAKILGPTLSAAFYRRDVLAALGGFDVTVGAALADVSAALSIQSLGKLHVCEPASQLVQLHPRSTEPAGGFVSGRGAERLFWRSASKRGLALALGLHTVSLFAEPACRGFGAALLASLIGRAAAWLEFGAVQRYERSLVEAADRLAELDERRTSIRKSAKRGHAKAELTQVPQRRAA